MIGTSEIIKQDSVGNAVQVTGCVGPRTVNAINLINTTAAVLFLQLFDAAAAANVTLGTTTPTWETTVAASTCTSDAGIPAGGVKFSLGIVAACTTTTTGSTTAAGHIRLAIL